MRLTWILLFALASLLLMGCRDTSSGDGKTDWYFENESTHRVTVEPNGTWFDDFFISPGNDIQIRTDEDYIQFSYSPASSVGVDYPGNNRVVFYNESRLTHETGEMGKHQSKSF